MQVFPFRGCGNDEVVDVDGMQQSLTPVPWKKGISHSPAFTVFSE